jgi:phosphoribosylanthranilate isomerase
MGVNVKFCGMNDPEHVEYALEIGVKWIGMVWYPSSPRHVSLEQMQLLANLCRGVAKLVIVTVNAPKDQLFDVIEAASPDYIQLHGRETMGTIQYLRQRGVGIIKAIHVENSEDIAQSVTQYAGHVDYFLLDTKPKNQDQLPGGNGQSFDWDLVKHYAAKEPWFLSGGLNEQNIQQALRISAATYVDLSSALEDAPGKKSKAKMQSFMQMVAD